MWTQMDEQKAHFLMTKKKILTFFSLRSLKVRWVHIFLTACFLCKICRTTAKNCLQTFSPKKHLAHFPQPFEAPTSQYPDISSKTYLTFHPTFFNCNKFFAMVILILHLYPLHFTIMLTNQLNPSSWMNALHLISPLYSPLTLVLVTYFS